MNARRAGPSRVLALAAAALWLGGCTPQAARAPAGAPSAREGLKDEMRMPWSPATSGYLRTWLLVGEFPNPPHPGQDAYDHTPPCVGLDTDYLTEHGGEAAIRPEPGLKHTRPDKSIAAWTEHTAPANVIDLDTAFPGRPNDNAVAYAFTTFTAAKAGPAYLAVGSDDGVRIWLNGQVVHDLLAARGVTPDQDLVPVTLKAGENTLLVKVEDGTGGWGFALRVLGPEQAMALQGGGIAPAIVGTDNADVLTVRTDVPWTLPGTAAAPVRVEVVAPGGKVVAAQEAPRGDLVRLDAKEWAEGPYEIRCTTPTPLGLREVRHLPWYRGDALAAARGLVEGAAGGDVSTPRGMLHRMLADMIQDRAGGPAAQAKTLTWPQVHSPLMEFAEMAEGIDPVRPYGFVRLAYRDEIDDSPQFCRCYFPAEYDPAKPWPLLVSLHGYNPPNPPYVQWWGVDQRHHPLADRYGVIVIEPHGRGNTGYRGIGEADVLRCVRLAKERFNVDERRVYLTGYSMGGGGTWWVGTRNTGVFAAIAPIYGGWDYHVRLDETDLAALTGRNRLRLERESSFAQAESLLTTPLFVNHGDADELVDPDQSRYAVRMLQRWGYDVRYWEHPGKGHGALGCEDALMEWFLARSRDPYPQKVRIRAVDLAGAHAHWVRVTARSDPLEMVVAEAEVLGPNLVRLDTRNALEVTLAPGGPMIDPDKPVKVVWNGADVRLVPMQDGQVTLQALGYVPGKLNKWPGFEGPIRAARETPFAIVLGTTSPDPLMRRMCERLARLEAQEWENWQHARPRVFTDTDMSRKDMAAYSLLLVGGPNENAVTKALADRLPLAIARDTVTLDGRTFKAPDAAIRFIYPSPLNARRCVVVTAATSAGGMYLADRMPDDVDFAIVDARIPDAPAGRPEEQVRLAAGFFDYAWRLGDPHLETGDEAVRARCAVRKVPGHASAAVEGRRLRLSDVLEAAAEGSFVAMQRDLNAQGRPIRMGGRTWASGLGVEVRHETCAAEWDLEGGGWTRLRADIGIEIEDPARLEPKHKDNTRVLFIVKGDGRELFRSKPFRWDSGPRPMDVNIRDVKRLRLEVANETTWFCAASSVNWADVRLEK